MRIAAVVEDFNSRKERAWQNGLAEAIREKTGADYVIAAMAGDFLEDARPAEEEKYQRAEGACATGVDLALELPVSVCLSDLATKAFSALSMLKRLYSVDDLVVLCRQETGERLSAIADFVFRASPEYQAELKRCLRREKDFFTAQAEAAECFFPGAVVLLSDPYHRMALELLKARYQLYWMIKPVFLDIAEIEESLKTDPEQLFPCTSEMEGKKSLERSRRLGRELSQLFRRMPEAEGKRRLEETPDGGPDLTERIWKNRDKLKQTEDLEEMIQILAEGTGQEPIEAERIRAFLMKLLIGIQRGNLIICGLRANCPYVRVLGVREGGANGVMRDEGNAALAFLQEKSWVPLLVEPVYEERIRKREREKLDECGQILAALDDTAHELYRRSCEKYQ